MSDEDFTEEEWLKSFDNHMSAYRRHMVYLGRKLNEAIQSANTERATSQAYLLRLSEHDAALKAKDAEIADLKAKLASMVEAVSEEKPNIDKQAMANLRARCGRQRRELKRLNRSQSALRAKLQASGESNAAVDAAIVKVLDQLKMPVNEPLVLGPSPYKKFQPRKVK